MTTAHATSGQPIQVVKLLRDSQDEDQPLAFKVACHRPPEGVMFGQVTTPYKVRIQGRPRYLPLGSFSVDQYACSPAFCDELGCYPSSQTWVGVDAGNDTRLRLTRKQYQRAARYLRHGKRYRIVFEDGRRRSVSISRPTGWVHYCYADRDPLSATDPANESSYSPDGINRPPQVAWSFDQFEWDRCRMQIAPISRERDQRYWDPEGGPVTTSWMVDGVPVTTSGDPQDPGNRIVMDDPGDPTALAVELAPGRHVVQVTVSDEGGARYSRRFLFSTHSSRL
ncbi:MAG: hypothetical protein IRZ21_11555 [Thermoleophilaceae bacterium]|nr:hypothetical protein [Thermoleophilaceae bacterium]